MAVTKNAGAVTLSQQVLVGVAILVVWEAAGRLTGSPWVSRPTDVLQSLGRLAAGDLYVHVGVTLYEIAVGLALGCVAGVLAGVTLGRARFWGAVMRPVVTAFYSVPLVSLTPLFIMFFGIDLLPKVILVAIVSFFLMFFITFSGAATIDNDLLVSGELMGATKFERFVKIMLPACMVWIASGFKTALPYSLVAATTGEMLAAKRGLGYLITQYASRLDMAGMYAVLVILAALGLIATELTHLVDRWLLGWRTAGRS